MPEAVELKAGVHWWCSCARSCHQPLCDGSHTGTGQRPVKFVLPGDQRVMLCTCKRTRNAPWCDGSHAACNNA